MKPGKPMLFAKIGRTSVFGLPGNPVSSMVCFHLYVKPAIWWYQHHEYYHPVVRAKLTSDYRKSDSRRHYIRVWLEWDDNCFLAHPVKKHGSAILSTMMNSNALAVIPEDFPPKSQLPAGTQVDVIIIEPEFLSYPPSS